MSHYLVVQLSREPISLGDQIIADDIQLDEAFMSTVADYVDELDYPYEEAVQLFVERLGASVTYNPEENSITFVNKEAFFRNDFERFKKLASELTLEQFMSYQWAWQVKESIKPYFGTYIYHYYSQQINEFMRDEVKNGDKFYIGGIVYYHC